MPHAPGYSLVTGATGLLAGHLIDALVQRSVRVRALTRPQSDVARLAPLAVELYVAGTRDEEALRASMDGVETVFHTAAAVDFWSGEGLLREANVHYTLRLFRAARAAGVRRFVHTSTIGVFGSGFRDVPEDAPHAPLPWSPYERTKAAAEQLLRELAAEGPPELVIVRPGYIIGERDTAGLVPNLLRALRQRRFGYVNGGRALTAPCYVGDVAEAHVLAALAPEAAGKSYHATDGTHTTVRDLVSEIARQEGLPEPSLSVPFGLAMSTAWVVEAGARMARRATMPQVTRTAVAMLGQDAHVSIARTTSELAYQPRTDYPEAVRRYLEWERASSSS